jgi:phosphatidylglycerophosphatase A
MKMIWKIIATFFGVGYFPLAPGTVTSFAIVLLYRLFLHKLSWPLYVILFLFLFFLGTFASSKYSSRLEEKDPRKIVVDEACGQLLVLFLVPESWLVLLLGFFLFRIFDIIKPFPIRKIENFSKGWGIMADDIMASIYAGLILHLYLLLK